MDAGNFVRNIAIHMRGILLGSLLAGVFVALLGALLPGAFSARSTLRVVPPDGQEVVATESLSTAVDWYVALGAVPSIAQRAGTLSEPPLSADQVISRTDLVAGPGPGEVVVVARAASEVEAISLSNAMASAVVEGVAADRTLALGETRPTVLVPAETAQKTGSGPGLLFVTGFLLGFVILATVSGLAHRQMNWRITGRILESLGRDYGIPAILDRDELAALLALRSRDGAQIWLAGGPGVSAAWWDSLLRAVESQGGPGSLSAVSPDGSLPAMTAGLLLQPDPNDGSAQALGAAGAVGTPALIVWGPGQRNRSARRFLERMPEFGIVCLAMSVASQK